ncbi:MAG: RIP metalloprotease RseP, partial [Candidatus Hydrogenedentales bacterium]
ENLELLVQRNGELLPMTVASRARGNIEGISFSPPLLPVLGVDTDEPPVIVEDADAANLHKGDVVLNLNAGNDPVDMENVGLLDPATELTVEVRRAGGLFGEGGTETVNVTAGQLLHGLTGSSGKERPEVEAITDEAKEATGLQRRDVITAIDGKPATIALLRDVVNNQRAESISVEVLRPRLFLGLGQQESTFEAEIPITSVQEIGVVWDTKMVYHRAAPADVLPEAWDSSVRVVNQVVVVLSQLVTGGLSAKMLGGPVMIYEVTTGAARTNFVMFLDIVAMISINLAIFNLLPLPVLDGGQLVMIGIEAIRRKPVSMRVQEAVLQVGLLLIIGLLVYVTFNDVSRIFERILP